MARLPRRLHVHLTQLFLRLHCRPLSLARYPETAPESFSSAVADTATALAQKIIRRHHYREAKAAAVASETLNCLFFILHENNHTIEHMLTVSIDGTVLRIKSTSLGLACTAHDYGVLALTIVSVAMQEQVQEPWSRFQSA